MSIYLATITFDLSDHLGEDFDPRRTKMWVSTNIDDETVIDTSVNEIRLGSGKVTINDDGTGTAYVWAPSTGANPASWQTTFHVDYADSGTRERKTRAFGPFTILGNADLAELVEEQEIPPAYLTTVTNLLDTYVAEAEAARDETIEISGLTGEDAAVGALVAGTGGAGPITRAALSASIDEEVAVRVPIEIAADGTVAAAAAAAADTAVAAELNTNTRIPRQETAQDGATHVFTTPTGKVLGKFNAAGEFEATKNRVGGLAAEAVGSDDFAFVALRSPTGKVGELVLDKGWKVPNAILLAWQARMGTLNAFDSVAAPFDIIVTAGQSNATQADTPPVTTGDLDRRLFVWNRSTGAIEQMAAARADVGAWFARDYVRNMPPGRRVLLVPCAVGSTGFDYGSTYSWDPDNVSATTNLYTRMIADVQAAKTAAAAASSGTAATVAALIWSQGEADRGTLTQSQYAAKLDDLIATARTDLSVSTLPVIIGSMTPEEGYADTGGTYTIPIEKALEDTPRRMQYTTYAWGPHDLAKYAETIHWSSQGQRARGRLFYEALYRARLNNSSVQPLPVQNLRCRRSGTTAFIEWDLPPARVTACTIQYKAGAGSWTTITLAGPLATKHTLAGLTASDTLLLRGSTTNEVGTSDYCREVAY